MGTFRTKRVWHSALKYASPLVVQFGTGQIVDSKYDDDAKLIYFTVRGDESEYYYQIENEQIARDLESVVAKEFYSLEADGSHEEGVLTLTPLDADNLPAITTTVSDKTVPAGFKEGYAPPGQSPGEFNLGSQEANMSLCLSAAHTLFRAEFGYESDDIVLGADERAIIERLAVSMFIQSNMNKFSIPVFAGGETDSEDSEDAEPITTGPDLTDLKELATGLTLQSGMSHDGKQLKRVLTSIADIESMDEEQLEKSMAWVIAEGEHQDGADGDDLPF